MPTITATTTHEIKLSPTIRRKLLTKLKTYAELRLQVKVLEAAMDKQKTEIGALRDETGEQSIELDGFKVTLVAGVRKKFNPKKYVALGGDLDLYNQAVEEKLNRPYEKISCPGDVEKEYE